MSDITIQYVVTSNLYQLEQGNIEKPPSTSPEDETGNPFEEILEIRGIEINWKEYALELETESNNQQKKFKELKQRILDLKKEKNSKGKERPGFCITLNNLLCFSQVAL